MIQDIFFRQVTRKERAEDPQSQQCHVKASSAASREKGESREKGKRWLNEGSLHPKLEAKQCKTSL